MSRQAKLSKPEALFLPAPKNVHTTNPEEPLKHRTNCMSMKLELAFKDDVPRVDAKVVEIALRRAAAQNRRLCCGVYWKEKEGRISTSSLLQLADKASQLELNFRYFETANPDKAEILAENLASREKNTPYAHVEYETHKPLLLWRASAVYCQGEGERKPKLTMIIGANHVLGDGLSLGVMTKNFAEALDMLLEVRKVAPSEVFNETRMWDMKVSRAEASLGKLPCASFHCLGILSCIYVTFYFFFTGCMERCSGDNKNYYRKLRTEPRTPHDPLPKPAVALGYFPASLGRATITSRFELSKEETANLRKRSREHNTTVGGALLAAAALAYRELLPATKRESCGRLSWSCTVSNRGYLPEDERLEFGNFSSIAIIKNERVKFPEAKGGSNTPEIWKLAKRLRDTTQRRYALENYGAGVMLILMSSLPYSWQDSMAGPTGQPNPKKIHAFDMTNLGNTLQKLFNEEMHLKNVIISSVEGGLNRDAFGGLIDFGVIVATHNGVLQCSIDVESAFFTQQEANSIASNMRTYLTWLASTPASLERNDEQLNN